MEVKKQEFQESKESLQCPQCSECPECPICYEVLDDSKITLKCNHTFHYECIKKTFMKNGNRLCPFCRVKSNYLELKKGDYPQRGIHKEFVLIEKCIRDNDFKKISEITHQFLDHTKCNAIIKTGLKQGYQCGKKKKKGFNFCHLHQNK